jgi:DNA-binding GntR family transcriptional regulator
MRPVTESGLIGHEIYETIRRDIIFGRLEAGARLRLERMKADYGASVSTIREALSRLTTEGLVEAEGQRGFSVAPISDENLREIAELRILVESHALAQSIQVGDTEWEGAIVSAHHKLHRMEERMEAGDTSVREIWKQYDWEFHQALILACGSKALLEVHGTIFDKYLRYQMRRLTYRGASAAAEHRGLLEAALNRDVERAQSILRIHIEGGVADSLKQTGA